MKNLMKNSTVSFRKLSLYTLVASMAVTTLLIMPITDSFINHSKVYTFFGFSLLVAMLFLVRSLKKSSFDFVMSPLSMPLGLLGLAALLSSFLTNAYPVENLVGMGGVYLGFVVVALLGSALLPKYSAKTFVLYMGGLAATIFALSLIQLAGFGPAQWINNATGLNIPGNFIFNVTGSPLVALQFSLIAMVGMIGYSVVNRKVDKAHAILLPILLIAAGAYVFNMLPEKPASLVLPSFTASWSVALDAIRSPRSAIIGVGPESYANAYNQFKPLWVNGQSYWNINFNQAASVPLTLLTTMGFLGLIAWILLAYKLVRMLKTVNEENKPVLWMAVSMMVLQLILPSNIVMMALLGATLAVLIAAERHKLPVLQLHALSAKITNLKKAEAMPAGTNQDKSFVSPFNIVAVVLLIGTITLTYLTGRTYAAQYYLNEANKAALQDDAVRTYQLQQRAIAMNPYLDIFRRQYSMTNLLIAIALSNKVDATEQNQQQVGELLQQAIREAQAATMLDPGDTNNWITLATIYENMIGATDEAPEWAVQAYVRAIETNPMDPNLRIALGGIFLGQEQFGQAAGIFEQAINIKPDYANSYYNLANALKQLNQLEQAKAAYQQVLALIDPNTDDYTQVALELEELEELIAQTGGDLEEGEESAGSQTPSILEQNLLNSGGLPSNASDLDLDQAMPEPVIDPATETPPTGDPNEPTSTTLPQGSESL